jgi:DNA polymerase-3 subunit gamma/tau
MIARLSDGGMRDALSLLDRCSAYADDITLDVVSNAAGIAGREYLFDLLEKISACDTAAAIKIVDELHGKSKDLKVLCSELLTMLRNLMLIKSTDNSRDLIVCLPEEFDRMAKISSSFSLDRIFECISLLQQSSERFARAADKRIELEMCMVRLCSSSRKKQHGTDNKSSVAQADSAEINELRAQISMLQKMISGGNSDKTMQMQTPAQPAKPSLPSKPQKKFDPNNFTPLNEWQEILEIIQERSPGIWAFLKNSMACIEGDTFCVVVSSEFFLKKFKASNDKALLKQIVNEYYGKDFGFMLYSSKNVDIRDKENPINELIKRAESMNIEVEIKN